MDSPEKQYFLDNPRNVKRLLYGFYALCALSLVAELFITRYVDHPWEALFGFYPIYGFLGIVILVMASVVLRKLVMREETYYDG
jgi:cadmium resistance protein CadD (predicted permease)